ncbi:MAG: 16S rRNA (guanine(966)-N(2))-methyltransferase RsmD [Thermaerobacter sp.]|nr:16S rRNA (guanine(966)-N(2))-methyltransferase RsmD [Thermaerobacter sp.]
MRVIAGSAGGLRLDTVPGNATRPTLDRVRESLFAMLAPRLPDARVLDLYAGTGALGIEALSRGAARCCFVDGEPRALAVLRENLRRTDLGDRADVLRLRLPSALQRLRDGGPYQLALLDPPYAAAPWEALLAGLRELLEPDGLAVCEHACRTPPGDQPGWSMVRRAQYGQTCVSILRRDGG